VGSDRNILIVEDDRKWRKAYRHAVEDYRPDLVIRLAGDLIGAEQLTKTTKFAVAFVDIDLDGHGANNVDGIKVLERIRATGDETSIIVVTGRGGQDVLPIIRDAIIKYGAHDAVGKSMLALSDIKRLLDEGLAEYRQAVKTSIVAARDALRGDADPIIWDDMVIRTAPCRNVYHLYEFLDGLLEKYLPLVNGPTDQPAAIDLSAGIVYGGYWSRGIGARVLVCFGARKQFDAMLETYAVPGKLFGKFEAGAAVEKRADAWLEGMVFPLRGPDATVDTRLHV
jgi:ActR/RegA family two-component response regulator